MTNRAIDRAKDIDGGRSSYAGWSRKARAYLFSMSSDDESKIRLWDLQ
jgi:hypothetical protein